MDHWVSDYWPIFEKQMHDVSSLSVTMSQKFFLLYIRCITFRTAEMHCSTSDIKKKEYEGCVITCN